MVRLTIRVDPPPSPYCQPFVIFFVCVSPLYDIMIMCVLKRILHKNKVTFIQLLESPIPPYCMLMLCHKMIG